MLASIMTGLVGWKISGLSLEHILSRYLILLFAMAGGAPLGAAVGVVTGLILSLADIGAIYQMSLLAFSGMLAGMLQGGRKGAVALGMLLGSSILSVYFSGPGDMMNSTWETCAAILLFLATPEASLRLLPNMCPARAITAALNMNMRGGCAILPRIGLLSSPRCSGSSPPASGRFHPPAKRANRAGRWSTL